MFVITCPTCKRDHHVPIWAPLICEGCRCRLIDVSCDGSVMLMAGVSVNAPVPGELLLQLPKTPPLSGREVVLSSSEALISLQLQRMRTEPAAALRAIQKISALQRGLLVACDEGGAEPLLEDEDDNVTEEGFGDSGMGVRMRGANITAPDGLAQVRGQPQVGDLSSRLVEEAIQAFSMFMGQRGEQERQRTFRALLSAAESARSRGDDERAELYEARLSELEQGDDDTVQTELVHEEVEPYLPQKQPAHLSVRHLDSGAMMDFPSLRQLVDYFTSHGESADSWDLRVDGGSWMPLLPWLDDQYGSEFSRLSPQAQLQRMADADPREPGREEPEQEESRVPGDHGDSP